MDTISLRPLHTAPAAELAALKRECFGDYLPSPQLAEVLAAESPGGGAVPPSEVAEAYGLGAFRGEVLVGWSQGYREGTRQFYMVNSGVVAAERRRGVYRLLVQGMLAHAESRNYVSVRSRHAAGNNGVIIAKLRLGFVVSGFEYSEVYGPLVQLTYLIGEARRTLFRDRATPIRPAP